VVTQGQGEQETLMVVLYHYDAEGDPRWALGSASGVDLAAEVIVEMRQFSGFCLECPAGEVDSAPVGTVRLSLVSPTQGPGGGNIANVDVEYLGAPGGSWRRVDSVVQLLSDPAP
jgi:hypothetical protein